MVANNELEAVRTVEFVLLLIVVIAEDTCEFVLALMMAASELEAVVIFERVANDPPLIVLSVRFLVANDHTNASRLDSCFPVVPAAVNVEVATFQTSAARLPKFVRVRPVTDHTELAIVLVETNVAPTTKVLFSFTRSPFETLPQVIWDGQTPSGPLSGIV
jgi:hypothetical protein